MAELIAVHVRRVYDLVRTVHAYSGKRALGKALSVSVFNQILSSATNFAIGFYLLRILPPEQFGLFGIGFSVTLFFGGIGNALLLIHMVVQIPLKSPSGRPAYVASMLLASFIFCLLSGLVVAGVATLASLLSTQIVRYVDLAAAISVASILYLLKDFFIRYAYSMLKEGLALKINLVIAATVASGFLVFHVDSAVQALFIYAAGQFVGAAAGFSMARIPLRSVTLYELRFHVQDAWNAGRWNVGTNVINWVRTQAYVTVTAGVYGPAGVATLNAVRLLFSPAIFLLPAVSQLVLPRLASLAAHKREDVVRVGVLVFTAILAVTLGYSVVVLFFFDQVSSAVLGFQYRDLDNVAFAWAAFMAAHVVAIGSTLVLQALREYSVLAVSGVVGTASMLASLYPSYAVFDIAGMVYAMAAGELVIAIILCWKILGSKIDTRSF